MADQISTVVVKRKAMATTVVRTDNHMPDLIIKVVSPLWIVAVRGLRVFLQTLVGLLTAGATGMASDVLPAADFGHLFMTCTSLAVGPAIICVLQNGIELLAKLDETVPQFRP